jgi:hypothetical protein
MLGALQRVIEGITVDNSKKKEEEEEEARSSHP